MFVRLFAHLITTANQVNSLELQGTPVQGITTHDVDDGQEALVFLDPEGGSQKATRVLVVVVIS